MVPPHHEKVAMNDRVIPLRPENNIVGIVTHVGASGAPSDAAPAALDITSLDATAIERMVSVLETIGSGAASVLTHGQIARNALAGIRQCQYRRADVGERHIALVVRNHLPEEDFEVLSSVQRLGHLVEVRDDGRELMVSIAGFGDDARLNGDTIKAMQKVGLSKVFIGLWTEFSRRGYAWICFVDDGFPIPGFEMFRW